MLFAALLVFTALAEAFMPILVAVLAPGFLDQPERFGPAVLFSRLTFPYLLCMALLAFFAGIPEQLLPLRGPLRRADPAQISC